MRFAIWDPEGKGLYLRQTMLEQGHQIASSVEPTDLVLVDCDWRWAQPRPDLIRQAAEAGAKVAVFPHGGLPTVFVYDGLTAADPLVSMRLEHGQGSIDVAETLGLDLSQRAYGWLYSPTRPFVPVEKPKKLLFAPQHPNIEAMNAGMNGHDPAPQLNQKVYKQLLKLGYEITVSLVGPAWKNGVWRHPGVSFVWNPQMRYDLSLALVEQTDVVVGAGSMAAAAVASGKPVVMFAQGDYTDWVDGRYQLPDHVDVYADELRYPLDVEYGDLPDLISRACEGDDAAAGWRARFVGDDGSLAAVGALVELVGDVPSSSANVIIEGVTARATGTGG
jgi:hypothetical protein